MGTCFVNTGNDTTSGFARPSSCLTRRGRTCSEVSTSGSGGCLLHSPDLRESSLKFTSERAGLKITMFHLNLFSHQLEDLEVTVSDHIQRVLKPNFGAAWDEVGDEYEKEETFTLSAIKTLEGKGLLSRAELLTFPPAGRVWRHSLAHFRSLTERLMGQNPSQAISPQLLNTELQLP